MFFGSIKRNIEAKFTGGSLEGSKLRVVVVEVFNAVQKMVFAQNYRSISLFTF